MITDAIIKVLSGVWSFVWGLIPGLPSLVTDFVDSSADSFDLFADVVAPFVSVLQVWQPVVVVLAVAGAWAATWFASVGIKVVRMVLSLFTGGGGSVA